MVAYMVPPLLTSSKSSTGRSTPCSADPKMKARIAEFGYTVVASSPADFGTFIAAYTEKWARVIRRR
jgi:hypothetical protein